MNKATVTTSEAATILGVTRQRVHAMMLAGQIDAIRKPGNLKFRLSDVERLKKLRAEMGITQ